MYDLVKLTNQKKKSFILYRIYKNLNKLLSKEVPLCQPVTFNKTNVRLLELNQYYISQKLDGIRCILIIDKFPSQICHSSGFYAVLCTRSHEMFELNCSAKANFFEGTLIDGELCSINEKYTYVPFDGIVINGQDIKSMDYIQRITLVKDFIASSKLSIEEFNILFKEECKNAPSDGILFMPILDPVVTGKQHNLFKYKSEHTIDFYLENNKIWYSKDGKLLSDAIFYNNHYFFLNFNENQQFQDGIVECKFVIREGLIDVIPLKQRRDKSIPNDVSTIIRTLDTMFEQMKLPEIMEYFLRNQWNCINCGDLLEIILNEGENKQMLLIPQR